jgi:hypothetical protein
VMHLSCDLHLFPTHQKKGAGKKGGLSENGHIGNGHNWIPIHLMTSFPICPFPIYIQS